MAREFLTERGGIDTAGPVHRKPGHLGVLVLDEPFDGVDHGVVFDRAREDPATPGVLGAAAPVDTLDGQVVALGTTGNEDHFGGSGAEGGRDRLPRLLDAPARCAPRSVQGGCVSDGGEDRRHRLDGRRKHRRRRGVIEVDGRGGTGGTGGGRGHDRSRIAGRRRCPSRSGGRRAGDIRHIPGRAGGHSPRKHAAPLLSKERGRAGIDLPERISPCAS